MVLVLKTDNPVLLLIWQGCVLKGGYKCLKSCLVTFFFYNFCVIKVYITVAWVMAGEVGPFGIFCYSHCLTLLFGDSCCNVLCYHTHCHWCQICPSRVSETYSRLSVAPTVTFRACSTIGRACSIYPMNKVAFHVDWPAIRLAVTSVSVFGKLVIVMVVMASALCHHSHDNGVFDFNTPTVATAMSAEGTSSHLSFQ